MGLRLVTATSTHALWETFASALLTEAGPPGALRRPAVAWLTHRLQRDRLFRAASQAGHQGWLNPPLMFFSELPRRFGLPTRTIGLLERHALLDQIARDLPGASGLPGLAAAADQLLSELLPNGVAIDQLTALLEPHADDAWTRQRNATLHALLQRYQDELARRDRYDPRAVHALLAERIQAGALPRVLGGATRLHLYGLPTDHTREHLLAALHNQRDVDVILYRLDEEACSTAMRLQPVPDEHREMDFVALEVKRLLVEQQRPPDRIAVVARTGRIDARQAYEALHRAGIPATARLRWSLSEVPALKAVLLLVRGAAEGWTYRGLRHVLESSYFDFAVHLGQIDRVAAERRIAGLAEWTRVLSGHLDLVRLAEHAARLEAARPFGDWITLTRELLAPGWFGFRDRICRAPRDRHDLVRLDQQAVLTLDALLTEWSTTETESATVPVVAWYHRLRRFLERNELALSTPLRTGVQVLEAHEAALVPFDHLFLVHANDGEFPASYRVSSLLTEEERDRIREAGIPLTTRASHRRRERSLWQAITSGPATTITWRTANAMGVPLLPSLFVPSANHADEIPRVRFVWDEPFSRAQGDRDAVRRFRDAVVANAPHTVSRTAPVARAIVAGVAESARLGSPDGSRPAGQPGPWNGQLRDGEVLEHLATEYGAGHVWSPSRLELYAQNPYVFFVQHILRFREIEEAEEDTSPMSVGTAGHALLEAFYRTRGGASLSREWTQEDEAALTALAPHVFARLESEHPWLGAPAIWRVRRRQVLDDVREYLRWELPRLVNHLPFHVEYTFGDPPVAISGIDVEGRPASLLLRGRIDRIDQTQSPPTHDVIDYKSGAPPERKGYADGATLQGPLYLAALRALGMEPGEAEYRSIRYRKAVARIGLIDPEGEAVLSMALTIPARIRAGLFEPAAAASTEWKHYWPGGLALVRVKHVLPRGTCRFPGEPPCPQNTVLV